VLIVQEVTDLLMAWTGDLAQCSRIFLRAPGRSQAVFFGGKKPLFSRSDPRLARISVETRRPTFRELQRVHEVLATVEVCGGLRLCYQLVLL